MKERTIPVWEAFDGQIFDSEAKCAAYERANLWRRIVGLTAEQVWAALAYETPEAQEIADVIATLGYRITDLRRKQRIRPAQPSEDRGEDRAIPSMTAAEAEAVTVA